MREGKPRHLHPGTIFARFITEAPQQILGFPALIALFSSGGLRWAVLVFVGLVALNIGVRALVWWRFTYAVLADELYIESGIFSRTKRSIPWDRVQDVDIERNLLARIFGWAKVKLETGGAGRDEGSLDSIAIADAETLRDLVRARRSGLLSRDFRAYIV